MDNGCLCNRTGSFRHYRKQAGLTQEKLAEKADWGSPDLADSEEDWHIDVLV
jgi:predicted transcriptional regulator